MISLSDKPEVHQAKPVSQPTPAATGPLSKLIKRTGCVIKELASDAPEALKREWDYYREKPTSAILALTWACTSRCKTCTIWRRNRRRDEELTIDEWLQVGETLAGQGVKTVELFGGDVFLRPELTVRLATLLKACGCTVGIPTNSNLLTREIAEELVKSVDVFYISTDGVDELHDKLRGRSGTFEKVLRAIDYFKEARGGSAGPRLVCNTTVSKHNCRTLTQIAQFAMGRGFDDIHFEYVGEFTDDHACHSQIGGYRPSPLYMRNGESALLTEELVDLTREQLKAVASFNGQTGESGRPFKVRTTSIDALSDANLIDGTVPGRRCFFERMTRIIDPYGNIAPCLFFDTFSLGSVHHGDLDSEFNVVRRKRFRTARNSGQLELCRHCIMSVTRNRSGRDVLSRAIMTGRQQVV